MKTIKKFFAVKFNMFNAYGLVDRFAGSEEFEPPRVYLAELALMLAKKADQKTQERVKEYYNAEISAGEDCKNAHFFVKITKATYVDSFVDAVNALFCAREYDPVVSDWLVYTLNSKDARILADISLALQSDDEEHVIVKNNEVYVPYNFVDKAERIIEMLGYQIDED